MLIKKLIKGTMNTLQQEQNVNPAFDENVLKAAGRAAQIEQKSVIIASQLLDAVMVAYDEDKPNKALVPVFIQHITEAIATARAEGAAAERERMSILLGKLKLTEDSLYNYYDVEKDPSVATKMTKSYNAALVEVGEALTTKEHHAS